MAQSPQVEKFSIDGQAGSLECLLELPGNVELRGIAVICHPHPVHGGTMQNKVVHTLARAFVMQGFGALRFNFRGVGESDGAFDEGNGEKDDVLSAASYMRERYPDMPLWLAGFSFGAAMAVRAAKETDVAGLISIAPAAFRLADETPSNPVSPWLIVHGENDELANIDDTIEWLNEMPPGPELCVFPDTTHFFHGKLIKLREVIASFVDQHAGSD
jgi:alpha/beta superfamily hydrolase